MGRIVQLQNKKTGENEYPRTYTKAIIDDQATPLDTLMQNQNDKIAELGSEVYNLEYTIGGKVSIPSDLFELGNVLFTNEGWSYVHSTNRIRIKEGLTISLKQGNVVHFSEYTNIKYYLGWINTKGEYKYKNELERDYEITEDGEYSILIATIDSSNIFDIPSITDKLSIDSEGIIGAISDLRKNDNLIDAKVVRGFVENVNQNIILGGNVPLSSELFELGNIAFGENEWSYVNSTNRIRIKEGLTLSLKKGNVIQFSDYTNIQYFLGWINTNGEYKHKDTLVQDYELTEDGEYSILIKAIDGGSISDISLYTDRISIESQGILNKVDKNTHVVFNSKMANGVINSNGVYVKQSYRVCTTEPVKFTKRARLGIKDGFRFGLVFSIGDAFGSYVTWQTHSALIHEGDEVYINISRTVDNTSETARIQEFLDAIIIDEDYKDTSMTSHAINNARIKIAMHRGDQTNAPGNSVLAFENAGKGKVWAIETDIRTTSDGRYVCIHDDDVSITTEGVGNVSEMTYSEVTSIKLKGQEALTIPSFEEYLGVCKLYGCIALIEIKSVADFATFSDTIVKYGLEHQSIVITSSIYAVRAFREKNQTIPILYITFNQDNYTGKKLEMQHTCNAGFDLIKSSLLSEEDLADNHKKGMIIGTWDSPSTESGIRAVLSNGYDFVSIDRLVEL